MADVFLSYSKDDLPRAQAMVAALEQLGFSVWWDDRLNPSESWDRLIEQEIADARAVLVLWTASSVDSDWVRLEANYGKENRKLVQASLEECRTPLAFSMLQRTDLSGWKVGEEHPGWRKLIEWLSNSTGVLPQAKAASGRTNEEIKSSNIAYWDAYNISAERFGVRRPLLSPVKGNNYYLYLSKKPEVCVAAYISRGKPRSIGVYVGMWGELAAAIFKAFNAERVSIENEFGAALEWTQQGPQVFWIVTTRAADPDDKQSWPEQHLWIAENMARLKSSIDPRLGRILASF